MPEQIDIIDAAKLYQRLELAGTSQIYKSLVLSIKTHEKDVNFKPSAGQSLVIWASIIGASLFPLLNSEASDEVINQAIEIWPYMFSEEMGIEHDEVSKTFKRFMEALISLQMGNDLSLWMRKELQLSENDSVFATKLNNLVVGNTGFWPMIFNKFGTPLAAKT